MPKKRSRVESGVHIEIDSHSQSPAEAEPSTASTTSTGKSVTLRLAKRGRYTQDISHTEVEEVVADETSQGGGDDREYDDDGLLDTDFGASTLEDTPNPESVREEVEADAENVKKTVRNAKCQRYQNLLYYIRLHLSMNGSSIGKNMLTNFFASTDWVMSTTNQCALLALPTPVFTNAKIVSVNICTVRPAH